MKLVRTMMICNVTKLVDMRERDRTLAVLRKHRPNSSAIRMYDVEKELYDAARKKGDKK